MDPALTTCFFLLHTFHQSGILIASTFVQRSMGSAASTSVRAAVRGASVQELRQLLSTLSEEESQKLWQAVTAVSDTCVCIRLPEQSFRGGKLELSPYDLASKGRSVPMVWCYRETLDIDAILAALQRTLQDYPVLCGRYASPPTAVDLNNAGVPVHMCTTSDALLSEALSHTPICCEDASPRTFVRNVHEQFVPAKQPMDPDAGSPDAPLLSIKITVFRSGGTAIGVLAQHGVVDAEALITFVANWSRVFRGLPLEPAPIHERGIVNNLETGDLPAGERPPHTKNKVVPKGEQHAPAFIGVMPKIGGDHSCLVPLPKAVLQEWKSTASVGLSGDQFVSTDDVVTARVWRALCAVRCTQLDLSSESDETTMCSRACNFRQRTNPALGAGYCANGVSQVWTELTVRDLLTMDTSAVALRLRASLQNHTSEVFAARGKWFHQQQQAGCNILLPFDSLALTFIISSWGFDWEAANFNAKPICFDHGALVPVVAVFVPRPDGDGLSVYASGPLQSMDQFIHLLLQKEP